MCFYIENNMRSFYVAGWSSPVARQAHNLKVVGSNPTPATKFKVSSCFSRAFFITLLLDFSGVCKSGRFYEKPLTTTLVLTLIS